MTEDKPLTDHDLFRVFDVRFLLIPVATRRIQWERREHGKTTSVNITEVFFFGIRVARLQGPLN